jgi:hypothetical protein
MATLITLPFAAAPRLFARFLFKPAFQGFCNPRVFGYALIRAVVQ